MTRKDVINYWREKSSIALETAHHDFEGGYLDATVNRIYYALFYEVTALLLIKDLSFKTHKGIKSALHNHFIKTLELNKELGAFYNMMYDLRFEGDYGLAATFKEKDVDEWLKQAKQFVEEIEKVIRKKV